MNITIYQQNNPTFHVLDGQKFKKEDYHVVYRTTEDDETYKGQPDNHILEDLFSFFNSGNYPEDYKGHSMSVGDIVQLNEKLYVCASLGWKQIFWSDYSYNDGRIDGLMDLLDYYPDKEHLSRQDVRDYIEYLENRFEEDK